jgi:hypothetical protein
VLAKEEKPATTFKLYFQETEAEALAIAEV